MCPFFACLGLGKREQLSVSLTPFIYNKIISAMGGEKKGKLDNKSFFHAIICGWLCHPSYLEQEFVDLDRGFNLSVECRANPMSVCKDWLD